MQTQGKTAQIRSGESQSTETFDSLSVENLAIAEFPANAPLPSFAFIQEHYFTIRTCQRSMLIGDHALLAELTDTILTRRFFRGASAYEFLLTFACGLESEIKGETDVFGQVKTAFKNLTKENPTLAQSLNQIFQKVFEDTKEIRAQYLQGVGGNTYGTLSRRILNPQPSDRVLILGAGQISKSVAPYFAEFDLKIWNRSYERLAQLGDALFVKGHSVTLIHRPEELGDALQNATMIVLATPPGSEMDAAVLDHVRSSGKKVLHLGGQIEDLAAFHGYSNFWSLTDLFGLEREQNIFREKQVQQASDACHQRAILRNLARSLSIPHGWEDLALFY